MDPSLRIASRQLSEYFSGSRQIFSLPIFMGGSSFAQSVWRRIMEIPYGKTASYSNIAISLGRPDSVRAVATACARNPLLIVVPCHRVIRSNGDMGGYSGGTARKRAMLKIERATISQDNVCLEGEKIQ